MLSAFCVTATTLGTGAEQRQTHSISPHGAGNEHKGKFRVYKQELHLEKNKGGMGGEGAKKMILLLNIWW